MCPTEVKWTIFLFTLEPSCSPKLGLSLLEPNSNILIAHTPIHSLSASCSHRIFLLFPALSPNLGLAASGVSVAFLLPSRSLADVGFSPHCQEA